MDNTENKEISIQEEKRAFIQKMYSELSQVLSGIHIKRDAGEISNCFSEIRKAVMLGEVKGDISSYVLSKMKEMNLLDNSSDVKKLEENVANFGERNNEAYSKLKERSNKEGGDSFVDNLSYRVFMDKSFSDVQANAIYRASMNASYNQYKGQKDADLSSDFKQGLKKSGRFTDEEINKLGEMAKMSIEATKDVEKLPKNIESLFNKKFESEKLKEAVAKNASRDVDNISKFPENQFEPKQNGQNESNQLKDKNNKVNENNFVSEVFGKAYLDRSFSDDKQHRIYSAAFDALYEQYKGGKQVNLTEVFMENIEKSGQFNDEEKKKLKEFSLKTEEDVKDAKNVPENLKELFDKKLKNEKEINDLENKTNRLKESNQYDGFDSVLFDKVYSDKSFSGEQKGKIILASMDALYAQYKDGKQVNLTEVFMESIEKSGKFNDEEKKKLKGLSLEAAEKVKDIDKVPERLVKNFEKALKFEEDLKKMNNINKANALNGSEYNVNIEANKQDEELKNLLAERAKKDAEWKKRHEEVNNNLEQKIQKVAQSRNDSNFLTSFMEEAVKLRPNPQQTSFIFNKLREVSEQTGNNSDKTSERADTLLKKSIKDSNLFTDFEKERLFETMDMLSNIYENDVRKPSDIKIDAKKENVVNNEKVEPALHKEDVNLKKENVVKSNELHNGHISMENRSIYKIEPEISPYMQMAKNKIDNENAPIGFASRILSDMDKHPHISRETKDMFLDMAIKTSKEVANQGLTMASIEGMEAFAEIIGKKMKDNKEFGENGLKNVKEMMEKGVYFNNLVMAKELTDKVLNAGIDDKPLENKKEEVKVENKPKETVNEAKSVNAKGNEGAKPLDAEFEQKLKRVENSEEYKNLVISANLNEAQQEAVKKAMALKLPSESKENAQNKVVIDEKPKENASKENKPKEEMPKEKVSDGKNVKSVEETLVDEVIKKGNLSKETGDEILNIAAQMEQSRLKGESLNGKTYSEVFMDKVIASKEISEKDKNKLLDMAIKTESREVASKEKGTRLYFDESKMARFDQLNLSDDMKKALDFEVKDGKFSIKIPEDDKLKKDVINRIKVQEGKEKIEQMNKGEMPKPQKPVMKDLSSNLAHFMAQNNGR